MDTPFTLSGRKPPSGELIGRPNPLQGIGEALRGAFSPRATDLPHDLQALLDKLR